MAPVEGEGEVGDAEGLKNGMRQEEGDGGISGGTRAVRGVQGRIQGYAQHTRQTEMIRDRRRCRSTGSREIDAACRQRQAGDGHLRAGRGADRDVYNANT